MFSISTRRSLLAFYQAVRCRGPDLFSLPGKGQALSEGLKLLFARHDRIEPAPPHICNLVSLSERVTLAVPCNRLHYCLYGQDITNGQGEQRWQQIDVEADTFWIIPQICLQRREYFVSQFEFVSPWLTAALSFVDDTCLFGYQNRDCVAFLKVSPSPRLWVLMSLCSAGDRHGWGKRESDVI